MQINISTKVADEFREDLNKWLPLLDSDEWAIAKARERIKSRLSPHEAYDAIVGVLQLAIFQTDMYAFASCCWLSLDLAKVADTTEIPPGFSDAMLRLRKHATVLGGNAHSEINKIIEWFRIR